MYVLAAPKVPRRLAAMPACLEFAVAGACRELAFGAQRRRRRARRATAVRPAFDRACLARCRPSAPATILAQNTHTLALALRATTSRALPSQRRLKKAEAKQIVQLCAGLRYAHKLDLC